MSTRSRGPSWRLTAIAVSAAVVAVAAALVSEGTDAPRLQGTMLYQSLHFRGGTLAKQQVLSLDLASRVRRTLYANGGTCCEGGNALEPSGRFLAVCSYDAGGGGTSRWLLDTRSGRRTPLRSTDGHFILGWTSTGMLLLLEQGATKHKILERTPRSTNVAYDTDRFVSAAIPLADGFLAVGQSSASARSCDGGDCGSGEIAIVRAGRVISTLRGWPIVGIDGGHALLYQRGGSRTELRLLRLVPTPPDVPLVDASGPFGSTSHGGAAVRDDGLVALAGDAIYVLDPSLARVRRLTTGNAPLAWAPDGSLVHGSADGRSIHITDLGGHSRVVVRGEDVRVVAFV